ncbi:MAG: hypothetical protein HYS13_10495 [Planctomycetia bacterium]|nr:hypothetical protein [Planctomycetia bacterium]
MTQPSATTATGRELFSRLKKGDRVEIGHEVRVGLRTWRTMTRGQVVRTERRRHGLHNPRNPDDKVYSDLIVLKRDDGELTTVTLDEFSVLRLLESRT